MEFGEGMDRDWRDGVPMERRATTGSVWVAEGVLSRHSHRGTAGGANGLGRDWECLSGMMRAGLAGLDLVTVPLVGRSGSASCCYCDCEHVFV